MTDMTSENTDLEIGVKPTQPEAGGPMQVSVALRGDSAAQADGLMAVLKDADGQDLASAPFQTDPDDGTLRARLNMIAPMAVGDCRWTLSVMRSAQTLARADVAFAVAAHILRPSVWNLPAAITAGETFRCTVGLAGAVSCSAANWAFVIEDQDGTVLKTGVTGPEPAPGTQGLHCAEITLRAPDRPGRQVWRVRPADPGLDHPHAPVCADIHLNVVARPDRVIRVLVQDAVSGEPVERARVTAHPFRTFTDAEGRARIDVPAGSYTVFVSGLQYFAFKTEADVQGDAEVDIIARMHVDRTYDEVDQWA
ncbi:carboxypeptidase-like regulatory domain-containing protein [Roseicyclus mahoneyensis]|uniref:Carboxypeptidase family protein n=1 Tax=Roseicyclus mahoneyensis TaxID=164332 RepID=A0A316GNB2_9RHOB|nr:carboxypeptidase-like regulatory domain-containing protein [Roseicyclus mahoneyensis]PWK62384.1 carboxypeptidase family protein [Roseicyclus mahoneyensis]